MRWLACAGVAAFVCAPAFVTAQVRKEAVDIAPPPPPVAAPARPAEAVKATTKKAQIVVPALGVVNRVRLVDGAANGMVEQWKRQYLPILRVEYRFVRTVCNPSKEQRIPIARAGFKALDEAAKDYVDWQVNRNQPMLAGGARPAAPDPRKRIQDALVAVVKSGLSPSQVERYRVELEARAAEARRVAILNFVAKLDQSLILSADQRSKLTDSLTSHWDEAWGVGLQNYNLDDLYVPMIPNQFVSMYLNDAQNRVWSGFQKVSLDYQNFFGGINMRDGPLDDEFADEVAKEVLPPKPEP
ncbi:hypothetical protein [Singulisphaera sp. GP187]|uniref:hypothetical protein n=1 Tax=Singulisphaera sp. GP187 TaxID=1882752 RepID=UPI000940ABE8|nr:hypothetical protein [Singulisphaera sp. GP187]